MPDDEGSAADALPRERVRVLVADERPLTRVGLRQVLEQHGFAVCAEVGDAASAVEAALRERPDVCLLDLHMDGDPVGATSQIASTGARVVLLTASRDDEALFEGVCAGACGCLSKDIDPERLPHVLNTTLEGEVRLPRAVLERLTEEFRDRQSYRRHPIANVEGRHLTSREWEVLDLLRQGLGTAEIARRLFISQVTVRTHVWAIVKKLRVADRDAAVRLLGGREERGNRTADESTRLSRRGARARSRVQRNQRAR